MTNDLKNIVPATNNQANVLMLVGTHCSFCGPMLKILMDMVKQGEITDLRVVNIEKEPAIASALGVRSVPWLQIGPFELTGARNKDEIQLWLQRASSAEGITAYLEEILAEGNVSAAIKLVERYPDALENVIDLMMQPEGKINVRLGAGVIIEELAESDTFKAVVPRLIDALANPDARIRGDACHYLSLTKDVSHLPLIKTLLSDESAEVREIAQDSVDELTIIS